MIYQSLEELQDHHQQNDKPLLSDFFHAHNGLLTLRIQPAQGPITIYGEQDPILNAWVADPGGTINIQGHCSCKADYITFMSKSLLLIMIEVCLCQRMPRNLIPILV